jgi:hypothetical protein
MRLSTNERWEMGFLTLLALLVAASALAAGWFDIVVSTRPIILSDQHCTSQPGGSDLSCTVGGGWEAVPTGWTLEAGRAGILLAAIDISPHLRLSALPFSERDPRDGRLFLSLHGSTAPGLHATLSLSRDGRTFERVMADVPLNGQRVDLTPLIGDAARVWVRLDTSMASKTLSARAAHLARLRVVTLKTPSPVPNVASAAILALTPILAYRVRKMSGAGSPLPYAMAVLGGTAVLLELIVQTWTFTQDPLRWWELMTDGQERDWYLLIPYLVLLGLLTLHSRAWRIGGAGQGWWSFFALAGILTWGLSRRLVAFAQTVDMKLDPDVIGYMQIAQTLASPYETHSREPMWIWITKGWFWLAGAGVVQVRLLTVLISLLMVALAYKVFRDYTERPLVGVLVALFLALNPYLIRLSVRGLREEAYAVAVLAVVYLIFVPHPWPRLSLPGQAIGLSIAGAAVQLLRFTSYTLLIPLLSVWVWKRASKRWGYALLPFALIFLVSLPHAVHNYRAFGDPLYSVNIHFSWLRNYEFVVKKGERCDGCPSAEQFFMTPYAGPPISGFHYVFGLRSLKDVVQETLQGYRRMFLSRSDWFEAQTGTKSKLGFACFLLGLALVLAGPYREMLAVTVLLANIVPFLMMHDVDLRLAVQIAPFATFILAYGCYRPLEHLARFWLWARNLPPGLDWRGSLQQAVRLRVARLGRVEPS